MRDIKFRSWDSEQKEFNTFDLLGRYDDHAYYLLDTDNVEQFTGLQGRSGVDVYEGDILFGESIVFGEVLGVVEIGKYDDNEAYEHEAHYGWHVNGMPLVDLIRDSLTVIGNHHQNPELVEK